MSWYNPANILKLVKWVVTPEKLEKEDAPSTRRSRTGDRTFLAWLLSSDQLSEEPVADAGRVSRFGDGGFLKWLLSADDLKEETPVSDA